MLISTVAYLVDQLEQVDTTGWTPQDEIDFMNALLAIVNRRQPHGPLARPAEEPVTSLARVAGAALRATILQRSQPTG